MNRVWGGCVGLRGTPAGQATLTLEFPNRPAQEVPVQLEPGKTTRVTFHIDGLTPEAR